MEAVIQRFSSKKFFHKVSQNFKNTTVMTRKVSKIGIFLWILRNYKDNSSVEHLRMAGSELSSIIMRHLRQFINFCYQVILEKWTKWSEMNCNKVQFFQKIILDL